MNKAYQYEISLKEQKDYVMQLCENQQLKNQFSTCISIKQFQKIVKDPEINQYLYHLARQQLYASQSFEMMEYHLQFMNVLFHYQNYTYMKQEIFHKITKRTVTLKEYKVIRYLISFTQCPFQQLIEKFYQDYHVDPLECAKICLIEDQYHLAYLYLRKLNYCQDEKVLDLLCSYSPLDYLLLMNHYQNKKEKYVVATLH